MQFEGVYITEEEAYTTNLGKCVDKSSSERADSECQTCGWNKPSRTDPTNSSAGIHHVSGAIIAILLLAQNVARDLKHDVRDIKD